MTIWTWRFGVSLWVGNWIYPMGWNRKLVYKRRWAEKPIGRRR